MPEGGMRVEPRREDGVLVPRELPLPLRWPLRLAIRSVAQELADTDGSIAQGAENWFKKHGVQIEAVDARGNVLPDSTLPSAEAEGKARRGTLLLGCHRNGTEAAFVAALLGRVGADLHVVVKPPGLQAQGLASVARHLRSEQQASPVAQRIMHAMLPVETAMIGRDMPSRDAAWRERLLWWAGMRRPLPTTRQIGIQNIATNKRAATLLGQGHSVLIFPSGKIAGSETPWQTGVAHIMSAVAPDAREQVDLRFFRLHDYPSLRFVGAVALKTKPPKTPVKVAFSDPWPLAELLPPGVRAQPAAIARELQGRFKGYFDTPA